MTSFKTTVLLFITMFMSFTAYSCDSAHPPWETFKKDATLTDYLLDYILLYPPGVHISRLYKIQPTSATNDSYEILEVTAATRDYLVTPGRKKLILVHGWYIDDSNSIGYPAPEKLHLRIVTTDNWGSFFNTSEFRTILLTYDVYAYDYLTSDPVSTNGERFRTILDSTMEGETDLVYIYAHSMGGLVTRHALYEGERPVYIKKIITAGTPFHGSPWASDGYQEQLASAGYIQEEISALARFLTNSAGGRDLAWDNFDGSLTTSENAYLTEMNSMTSRNDLITATFGSCDAAADPLDVCNGVSSETSESLIVGCVILEGVSGNAYNPSDCIVPAKSASFQITASPTDFSAGNSYATSVTDLGGFDHQDIKLKASSMRTNLLTELGL